MQSVSRNSLLRNHHQEEMELLGELVRVREMHSFLVWILFLALGYIVWILFFRPYNLVKDYTEFANKSNNGRNDAKRATVNLALRRRKRGNLPPDYPNSWYSILESDEIRKGDVKEIFALGQNLVAWRGKQSGQVYVADAYCPHLGAHLGVGGSVINDCIQCPFHKWSFEGCSGKVHDIPYTSNNNKMTIENLAGLKMWQTVEANGFIYIWFHVNGEEPSWYPEEIDGMTAGKWKYHGRSEFQVTCHIQEIPENGADVTHLAPLHEAPALVMGSPTFTNILGKIVKHQWNANWKINEEPGHEHESLVNIKHHLGLFGDIISCFQVNVTAKQIGAGIVMMHLSSGFWRGILVQNVTPVEPLLQKITHRIYSNSRLLHFLGLYALHGEAIQISRDIEIWNRKCYLQNPILLKEDAQIKLFRRWFSQFYSDERIGTSDSEKN